jgi:hypothetical protein
MVAGVSLCVYVFACVCLCVCEIGYKMSRRVQGVGEFELVLLRGGGDRSHMTLCVSGWLARPADLCVRRPVSVCLCATACAVSVSLPPSLPLSICMCASAVPLLTLLGVRVRAMAVCARGCAWPTAATSTPCSGRRRRCWRWGPPCGAWRPHKHST